MHISSPMTKKCDDSVEERCQSLHIPSATAYGPYAKAWLERKAIGNEIDKDADNCYMHQTIHSGNPFGLECNNWDNFVTSLCNKQADENKDQGINKEHKLIMALITRGNTPNGYHKKFQPSHVIEYKAGHGMMCMVHKEVFFEVVNSTGGSQDSIVEITRDRYDVSNEKHVLAQMIAFGTICDNKVPEYGVWFNLRQDCLKELNSCNEEDKKLSMKNIDREDLHAARETKKDVMDMLTTCSSSSFMLHPTTDIDAFNFQTNVLQLRLQLLNANGIKDEKAYRRREDFLKAEFQCLKKYWHAWSWPPCANRLPVDTTTKVPQVNADYCHPMEEGQMTGHVWKSFVSFVS
eukprot:15365811-Ditylum_brightwellii.AAC.1